MSFVNNHQNLYVMAEPTFQIEELDDGETVAGLCNEVIEAYVSSGLIKISPSNCVLPKNYGQHIHRIRSFPIRDEDVFLISNPKCGTTWAQEMTWLIGNDVDLEAAKQDLGDRFPNLELGACVNWMENSLTKIEQMPGRRFLKSHLPKILLPVQTWQKNCKIIFVVRDGRDAAISNCHYYRLIHGYHGTLDQFLDYTLAERVLYSPFWEHAIEFWKMRDEPNVLFLTYEDMKKDLRSVVLKTAVFLGKTLSEEKIAALLDHLSFEKMKTNPAVNLEPLIEWIEKKRDVKLGEGSFIREGKAGGWRNNFTPEMVEKFKNWTEKKLKGTGLDELYC